MKLHIFLNKLYDSDDWGNINKRIFDWFDKNGGVILVIYLQIQIILRSKFVCPLSSGVDAFCFNWRDGFNWIVHPVSLVVKTVSHLIACKAKGTLIVPKWTSAIYWPCLMNKENDFF